MSKPAPAAPGAKVPVVLDHGGQIDFVSPGQLEAHIQAGTGRAATMQDLRLAGVEGPRQLPDPAAPAAPPRAKRPRAPKPPIAPPAPPAPPPAEQE